MDGSAILGKMRSKVKVTTISNIVKDDGGKSINGSPTEGHTQGVMGCQNTPSAEV